MFEDPSPSDATDGPLRYLTSPLLAAAGVPHLFTTRHFPGWNSARGSGAVFDDREALALVAALGLGAEPAAFARQVHGARVQEALRGGLVGEADVLATSRRGLPLAIFSADCVPIVVYDPVKRGLAVAHAGWRGTAQSAARAAAGRLVAAGGDPVTFVAAIGPSIGPCCYEVDAPVIERFASAFPERWRDWVAAAGPGKWMLDLWGSNEEQLQMAGLDGARIENLRLCTSCRGDLFFSYRRARGEGRLVALAAIPAVER